MISRRHRLRWEGSVRTREIVLAMAIIGAVMLPGSTRAQLQRPQLEALAAAMASHLAAACPPAAPGDLAAFKKCVAAIQNDRSIPFGDRLLWGGDQPQKSIRKKGVTNFQKDVFRLM